MELVERMVVHHLDLVVVQIQMLQQVASLEQPRRHAVDAVVVRVQSLQAHGQVAWYVPDEILTNVQVVEHAQSNKGVPVDALDQVPVKIEYLDLTRFPEVSPVDPRDVVLGHAQVFDAVRETSRHSRQAAVCEVYQLQVAVRSKVKRDRLYWIVTQHEEFQQR